MVSDNFVRAFWYMSNNFGDSLNYNLLRWVFEKEPIITFNREEDHLIMCGSIITEANKHTTVIGAGFANHGESIDENIKVKTVRGELSRSALNIKYAKIPIGDPALLAPKFYSPDIFRITDRVGFIPHWSDLERASLLNIHNDFHLINPLKPVDELIKDVLSCERVVSSSLHGLIIADAYKIPNAWFSFGTPIGGDGFKFQDYYSTTERPKEVSNHLAELNYFVSNYKYDLEELLWAMQSCA
jgi:pyruvyltransferase